MDPVLTAKRVMADPAKFIRDARYRVGWLRRSGADRYAFMQKHAYDELAGVSNLSVGHHDDLVVGSYDEQDAWPDYDAYLMRYVDGSFRQKMALDFACGPGRNIVKYSHRFARLDGADIGARNLENARDNLRRHGVAIPELYLTGGRDVGAAASKFYDFVFSTIALQHICVHETRFAILTDIFRILKPGGRFSAQMGYGADSPNTVGYFENNYDAVWTNRYCDTRIETPEQIAGDLAKIGFVDFEHWIRPTGPGDCHPQWIFFTATRPTL